MLERCTVVVRMILLLTLLLGNVLLSGFRPQPSSREVARKISAIVHNENPFKSISDSGIVAHLAQEGIPLLAKSVQLHRHALGIADFKQRRRAALKRKVAELVAGESAHDPLSDEQIAAQLQQYGADVTALNVEYLRAELSIPSPLARTQGELVDGIIASEPRHQQYSDKEIAKIARTHGVKMRTREVKPIRDRLGIPPPTLRGMSALEDAVVEVIEGENPLAALDDAQIAALLAKQGFSVSNHTVRRARIRRGVPVVHTRRLDAIRNRIKEYLAEAGDAYSDAELASMLKEEGAKLDTKLVGRYRREVGGAAYTDRRFAIRVHKLKKLIADEDKRAPHTDVELSKLLHAAGVPTPTMLVLKLRRRAAIPSSEQRLAGERRYDPIDQEIQQLVANESPTRPLTEGDIVAHLADRGYRAGHTKVRNHLRALGIKKSSVRRADAIHRYIADFIAAEDPANPLSDVDLLRMLRQAGFTISNTSLVQYHRKHCGIASCKVRKKHKASDK